MEPDIPGSLMSQTNKRPGAASLGPGLPEIARLVPPRPKRSQVTRACDWCRIHRVKCDHYRPCSNCQNRGAECSKSSASEIHSLPHAFREIERLKQRIRELEKDVEDERRRSQESATAAATAMVLRIADPWEQRQYYYPHPHAITTDLPATPLSMTPTANGNSPFAARSSTTTPRCFPQGIFVGTSGLDQRTWYGQSSLICFTSRMSNFIALALQQPFTAQLLQPDSASKVLATPISALQGEGVKDVFSSSSSASSDDGLIISDTPSESDDCCLTATQEEYFLGLFWQSYHTSLAIIDETEFKQHYKSLWAARPGGKRRSSALVDIVLAVCMQYGMARNQGQGQLPQTFGSQAGHGSEGEGKGERVNGFDANDAAIAGRWYYHRCQTLLAAELESPTLSTLQCAVLMVLWLRYASFQNTACGTLAMAVNMTHALGLHVPAPSDTPCREVELRKRLWWSVYVLDTKISMALGRPFMTIYQPDNPMNIPNSLLPADDYEAAALSGSEFSPLGPDTTWLSWGVQSTKLIAAARGVYTAFYNGTWANLTSTNDDSNVNSEAREASAAFLAEKMKALVAWAADVPEALLLARRRSGGNVPFSTDCSPVDMEQFAPAWVQHQRLTLELQYHSLCVTLWRPFIPLDTTPPPPPPSTFSSMPNTTTSTTPILGKHVPSSTRGPITESCANNCARHAIALTYILRQVLTTTGVLAGWHEAFEWQWDSAITLAGFALSRTGSDDPLVRKARDTLAAATQVFDIFGTCSTAASSAASIMRKLQVIIDQVAAASAEKDRRVMAMAQTEHHQQQHDGMDGFTRGWQQHHSGAAAGSSSDGGSSTAATLLELDEGSIAAMREIVFSRPLDVDIDFAMDYADGMDLPSI